MIYFQWPMDRKFGSRVRGATDGHGRNTEKRKKWAGTQWNLSVLCFNSVISVSFRGGDGSYSMADDREFRKTPMRSHGRTQKEHGKRIAHTIDWRYRKNFENSRPESVFPFLKMAVSPRSDLKNF